MNGAKLHAKEIKKLKKEPCTCDPEVGWVCDRCNRIRELRWDDSDEGLGVGWGT